MADLELRRGLSAPVDRVWRALTEPDAVAAWFWPARFHTAVAVDLRVAGRYRIGVSTVGIAVSGDYLLVDAPRRLEFGWQWDGEAERTTVSVSEFLCDPQQVGHSAGVAVPDGDGGGVYVAVEAVAEDGCADPVWAPCGEGTRVRHLAARVGRLGLPSRRTLAGPCSGGGRGGSLPSPGRQG